MEQFFIQDGWRNYVPPIERRQEGDPVNQDNDALMKLRNCTMR